MEIVAGLLKSDSARKLQISGHTDSQGTADYNLTLSRQRAEIATSTLKQLGVNAAQIIETGLGSTLPLDPNRRQDGTDNPEGRSRNRRTEIYLDF
jgi:outer membrane protein OmpA-like peptidoglycan-associated protein